MEKNALWAGEGVVVIPQNDHNWKKLSSADLFF